MHSAGIYATCRVFVERWTADDTRGELMPIQLGAKAPAQRREAPCGGVAAGLSVERLDASTGFADFRGRVAGIVAEAPIEMGQICEADLVSDAGDAEYLPPRIDHSMGGG